MDYLKHVMSCVSLGGSWRWCPPHTEHIHMTFSWYESSFVVSWDEFLVTQSTDIWIVPKYDSLCVSVYCSRRWQIYHTEHTDMNSPQNEASSVSSYGGWIWIHCHTEHNDMKSCWDHSSSGSRRLGPCHTNHSVLNFPQYDSFCVSLCGSCRWIS